MKNFKQYPFVLASLFFATSSAQALVVEFEKDNRLPVVYLTAALSVGSASDPVGKEGLTNFLTELMLRNTKFRNKEDIDRELDQLGATISTSTRTEMIEFESAVLAKNLTPFLVLMKEILTQPGFSKSEIARLKQEMLSSLQAAKDSDGALASYFFPKLLFGSHPYGNPKEGTPTSVKSFTGEDLEKQYARIFQPNFFITVGTGDADSRTIIDWAKSVDLGPNEGQEKLKVPAPQFYGSERILLIDKPGRTQTQILVGQSGLKMTDFDYYALSVANHAFGGPTFSSRLMQEIRVKRGWSYGASSGFRFGTQPHSWQLHIFPATKDTPAALRKLIDLIRDLKMAGIAPEEFEFSKTSIIQGAAFSYDTPAKRVENTLIEKIYGLPSSFFRDYADHVKDVTLAQVNQALQRFVQPDHLQITIVGTAAELKPRLIQEAGFSDSEIQVRDYRSE